jgi:hypothetical protein
MVQRRLDSPLRRWALLAGALIASVLVAAPAHAAVLPISFGPKFTVYTATASSQPTVVLTGDFNQDSKGDVLSVQQNAQPGEDTDDVTVASGNGQGLFNAPTFVNVSGDGVTRVAIGEFNGDSDPDIALVQRDTGDVEIATGAVGTGFSAPVTLDVPGSTSVFGIAVGEFNGDSDPDLAVATTNGASGSGVVIFTGTGATAATFANAGTIAMGNSPNGVVAGEFNGDGDTDLAISTIGDNKVNIQTGAAGAGFTSAGSFASGGTTPVWLASADFDDDRS